MAANPHPSLLDIFGNHWGNESVSETANSGYGGSGTALFGGDPLTLDEQWAMGGAFVEEDAVAGPSDDTEGQTFPMDPVDFSPQLESFENSSDSPSDSALDLFIAELKIRLLLEACQESPSSLEGLGYPSGEMDFHRGSDPVPGEGLTFDPPADSLNIFPDTMMPNVPPRRLPLSPIQESCLSQPQPASQAQDVQGIGLCCPAPALLDEEPFPTSDPLHSFSDFPQPTSPSAWNVDASPPSAAFTLQIPRGGGPLTYASESGPSLQSASSATRSTRGDLERDNLHRYGVKWSPQILCRWGDVECPAVLQYTVKAVEEHLKSVHHVNLDGNEMMLCQWAGTCKGRVDGVSASELVRHIVTANGHPMSLFVHDSTGWAKRDQQCRFCDSAFSRSDILRKHVKQKHGVVDNNNREEENQDPATSAPPRKRQKTCHGNA